MRILAQYAISALTAAALLLPGLASAEPAAAGPGEGYVGVGVALHPGRDGYQVIEAIMPSAGSDAKTKLRKGDRIIKIDGKSLRGVTSDETVKRLHGKEGSIVTLTLVRSGVRKPISVKISRRAFHPGR